MNSMEKQNDLSKRLFNFAVRCIKFLRTLSGAAEYRVIKYQLIKSSTSSGANRSLSRNSVSDSESSLLRLVKSKKAEFTCVIEHFFDKLNEDSGLYGQKLIMRKLR